MIKDLTPGLQACRVQGAGQEENSARPSGLQISHGPQAPMGYTRESNVLPCRFLARLRLAGDIAPARRLSLLQRAARRRYPAAMPAAAASSSARDPGSGTLLR